MDYLDPKKKRAHARRLYVGYGLMSIIIAITTTILVYVANGYYIDTKTGQVFQNGLVYLDTKPESASVTLNGVLQGDRTASKLTIPAGDHTIEMNRDGYRPWKRLLQLEGGSLRRLTYARLFPVDLSQRAIQNFVEQPVDMLQSIDRQWVISSFVSGQISVYNTNTPEVAPVVVTLPQNLLTIKAPVSFDFLDWSDDHKTILTKVSNQEGAFEFIVIDREDASRSVNVDVVLGQKFTDVKFRDRKNSQLFVFKTNEAGLVSVASANLSTGILSIDQISSALRIEPFGQESFAYITKPVTTEPTTKVEVRLKDGDKDVLIKEIEEDIPQNYLLEIAKLGNGLVVGVASPKEDRAMIFRNPLGYLRSNPEARLPLISATMRIEEPKELSFSVDATSAVVRNANDFVSYELEEDKVYRFTITEQLEQKKIEWMDGQHFYGYSNGKLLVSDFDGSNQQVLVSASSGYNVFFSENYERLLSVSAPVDALPWRLDLTELRTPQDL